MPKSRSPDKEVRSKSARAQREVNFCWNQGCRKKGAKCHVISESVQLGIYGKKCLVAKSRPDPQKGEEFDFCEVGIGSAAISRSFCSSCDEKLFRKLDNDFCLTKETAQLQAYRALALKYWVHRCNYHHVPIQEKVTGRPASSFLSLRSPALGNLHNENIRYEAYLVERKRRLLDLENLVSLRLSLNREPGFRMSASTTLGLDVFGRAPPFAPAFSEVCVSVLSDTRGAFLSLTFDVQNERAGKYLADSFLEISDEDLGSWIVSYFIFNPAGLTLPKDYVGKLSKQSVASIRRRVLAQKKAEHTADMSGKLKHTHLVQRHIRKLTDSANSLSISRIEVGRRAIARPPTFLGIDTRF